jgi:hypothetical protein
MGGRRIATRAWGAASGSSSRRRSPPPSGRLRRRRNVLEIPGSPDAAAYCSAGELDRAVSPGVLGWILAAVGPLFFLWAHVPHPAFSGAAARTPSRPRIRRRRRARRRRRRESRDALTAQRRGRRRPGGRSPARSSPSLDPEGRGDVLAPGRSREIRDRGDPDGRAGRVPFRRPVAGTPDAVARPENRAPAWSEPFLVERYASPHAEIAFAAVAVRLDSSARGPDVHEPDSRRCRRRATAR